MEKNKQTGMGRLRPIELEYQPVFDIHLNMAIDYEVSMRINDKVMGVMLPEQFIPVAEKSNQICQLGLWAIEECCEVYKRCEAREADIGIAGGDGEALLFRHGEIIGKIPEGEIIDGLIRGINNGI